MDKSVSSTLHGQIPSSVTLAASSNPVGFGQPVTLTATVTAGATGGVTFYDGATVLGAGTLSGTQATLITVMLPSGARSLRAYYRGDATHAASSSASLPLAVTAVASLGLKRPSGFGPVNSFATAVGDFNGDGKQDLVAANNGASVNVLLGNGDGTFQPAVSYTTPSSTAGVAVGDFNGDGKLDVVVTNRYSSSVSILLGNGDGTFQAAANYTTAVNPYAVAVGDFNNDGKADLAVGSNGSYSVSVLLGNGDGTFGAALSTSAGTYQYSVAIADLNSDGKADIVVGTSGGLAVLMGIGNGTFAAAVNYYGGSGSATGLVIADFNGDGKPDLAANTYYSGTYIFLGNGDGTFGLNASYLNSSYTYGLVAADMDGDGKLDLVTVGYNSNSASLFYGNGDGTFQPAVSYSAGTYPGAVTVGDFNNDGKADLIVRNDGGTTGLSTLLGGATPDLTLTVSHGSGFTQGQTGALFTITVTNGGDVASSGAIGVVVALPAGFTATSLAGNGWTCVLATLACVRSDSMAVGASTTITAKLNVLGNLTGSVLSTFTVSGGGDLNSANNYATDTSFVRTITATTLASSLNPAVLGQAVTLSATVTSGATGSVSFSDGLNFLGAASLAGGHAALNTYLLPSGTRGLRATYSGDATHGPSVSPTLTQSIQASPTNGVLATASYSAVGSQWVGIADFNGDGKQDLVTANNNYNSGIPGMSVLLGNGDGTFRTAVGYASGLSFSSGVLGDFNRDGKTDVALAGSSGIYVLLGNGDGTFQSPVIVSSTSYGNLASADFNSDGKLDFVATTNGTVVMLLGNGDGSFQAPVTVPVNGANLSSIAVVDMNLDGMPDLIVLSGYSSSVATVLLGNGDGTFQTPIPGPAGNPGTPFGITVGDFNGDGKPDLAIVYWIGIYVQLGNGDGTLNPSISSTAGGVCGYFAFAGDFNGDGKLDLAYAGYYSNTIYLSLGNGDGTFQTPIYPSTTFTTDGYPGIMAMGDFNGDGRPDFAVANTNTAGSVNVFLGGQFSSMNISATHAASFIAGQTASYQIVITNPAFLATNGTITVSDTLPAGLTATAISGYGWACGLSPLSCSRSDALGQGQSYSPITVTVSVSSSLAPTTLTNRATVTGGGIPSTVNDPTLIVSATTTTLLVTPSPSALGQYVTMSATVTSGVSGTVLFSDGGTPLGTAVVTGSQATFTTRMLPAGPHTVVATYSGDLTHGPSSSVARVQSVNAAAASGLANAVSYAVGASPIGLAAADFNGDGKTDLVTANTGGTISVLLGTGSGTFQAASSYAVGTNPSAVVTGDFNNDGKTDIAVVNQGSNNVSILLGKGDGTFQAAVNYPTGKGPVSMALGDFDRDGRADLVIANGTDGTITVLSGNGDGTFRTSGVPISTYSISFVAVADFNLDGKPDILYVYSNYYYYILLGNGDGTFQSALGTSANSFYGTTVGDLNGDGKPDLITADSTGVSVLLGKGDGTFQTYVHYATGFQGASVMLADVNGDGKLDVVDVNSTGGSVAVLMGNGDGTLQPAISYTVGSSPQRVVAGDFNGDGRTDLAITNSGSNNISVLLGVLTPVFSITSSHTGAFGIGQTGATYVLTVTNNGPGSTTGGVTVTDTLPAGLTATAMAGNGWSCTLSSLSCIRSESLAPGLSYPPITLTVNVTLSSTGSVTNIASVSGGGAIGASAFDQTAIAAPALSVTKSHMGNFAQGQTNATYKVIVSNSAVAAPTSGTVTVTETLPAGLTLVSMAGTGWSCPGGNTCSRIDALTPGTSYPPITVTVNVAANALAQVTNQVSVSGGGSTSANASDPTTVLQAGGAPAFQTLSPPGLTGTSGLFTLQFFDGNGSTDLNRVQIVINDYLRGFRSCLAYYTANADVMYLLDDGGSRWMGPIPFGTAGVLTNSQCALDMSRSTRVRSGNTLTLNLFFTFNPGFVGGKNIFTEVMNNSAQSLGWQTVGGYTVTPGTNTPPTINSVTPNAGSGSSNLFRVQLSDPDGGGDLDRLQLIIQNGFNPTNSCYVYYAALSGLIYLASDNPAVFLGPVMIGQPATLQNSQCMLRVGTSGVLYAGNSMEVDLDIAFKTPFTGAKTVYAETRDRSNAGANNWVALGTWTAAGLVNQVPAVDAVAPATGAGRTGLFTVQYSDGNGYTDLERVQVLFNSTLNPGTGCLIQYVRGANLMYLLNDAGTGWIGPAMVGPGGGGVLQNSRCAVNAGGTVVTASGNSMQVLFPMTFWTPAFNGVKNIYGEATDSGGLSSNWHSVGTWTVQ